jgi:hypothetical protein
MCRSQDLPHNPPHQQLEEHEKATEPVLPIRVDFRTGDKRKEDVDGFDTPDEPQRPSSVDPDTVQALRGPKIARACDACRRKRIRCNAIPGADPPMCLACQQQRANCTWVSFIPSQEPSSCFRASDIRSLLVPPNFSNPSQA